MPAVDDDMSLKEIARILADFRMEFRSWQATVLQSAVYQADQRVIDLRLAALEKDRDAAEANAASVRRLALGAILTAVGTVIAALILIALN